MLQRMLGQLRRKAVRIVEEELEYLIPAASWVGVGEDLRWTN